MASANTQSSQTTHAATIETLSLRVQRTEDNSVNLEKVVTTLVNKLDKLADKINSLDVFSQRFETMERDLSLAFMAQRDFSTRLENGFKELREALVDHADAHDRKSSDWIQKEFNPVRTKVDNWSGRFWAVNTMAWVVIGLTQFIAYDKLKVLDDASKESQRHEVQISTINSQLSDIKQSLQTLQTQQDQGRVSVTLPAPKLKMQPSVFQR